MKYIISAQDNDVICHHGVKGQKWGVRRYQNKDGSRTSAGKKRYTKKDREMKNVMAAMDRMGERMLKNKSPLFNNSLYKKVQGLSNMTMFQFFGKGKDAEIIKAQIDRGQRAIQSGDYNKLKQINDDYARAYLKKIGVDVR